MSEFKVGEEVYIWRGEIHRQIIQSIDPIDGIKRYWLDNMFGYYHKDSLYKSKNEAIDAMIKHLEAMRE